MLRDELDIIIETYYNYTPSLKTVSPYVNELIQMFGRKSLISFKQKDIKKYIQLLQAKGNKPNTINCKLSFLKKSLQHYNNKLSIDFLTRTHNPKPPINNKSYQDILLALNKSNDPELKQFILIAHYTGLKVKDILNIKNEQLKKLNDKYFLELIHQHKHKLTNIIPLDTNLNNILDDFKPFTMNYKQLYYKLKKLNISSHQLRTTFINDCLNNSLDSFTTMKLSNLRALKGYT